MRQMAKCHPDEVLQGHGLCRKCYAREYARKQRAKNPKRFKDYNLRRMYGVTIEVYTRMYNQQSGRCAICMRALPTLCVDHDHTTGEIRGLLCRLCNKALGSFKDNEKNLQRAIWYVRGDLFFVEPI